MKYARLSLHDLKDLEKEFVEFLVVNGIEADEWENLKKEETEKVEKIIGQFSDVIWEGVLRKTEFVEHRSKNKLTICRVKNEELITLHIQSNDSNLDLTKHDDISTIIFTVKKDEVRVQKEAIKKESTAQLFELLQAGFYLAKDAKYEELIKEVGQ